MKDFLGDSGDSRNDKITKEDKIQILIKIIPILLIIVILLITLIVNKMKNKSSVEPEKDTVSTEIIVPSPTEEGALGETDTASPQMTVSENSASAEQTPDPSATPSDLVDEKLDFGNVKFDTQAQLQEMMTYWEQGNQEALDDLANLDRFRAMSYQLKGTTEFYYSGETNADGRPDGKGIAVYADNQYYYGDWKNGVREGEGRWMHYHIHASADSRDIYQFHQYSGSFRNDLPNGQGSEHYDFVIQNLQKGIRYYSNLIGTYKQGLLDGSIYITTIDQKNNMEEWNATAKMGSFVYLSDQKDKQGRKPALVDTEDEENFIWLSEQENQNWGVACYISSNK